MDPTPLTTAQWAQITRLLSYLFLFTGLALTSAMAFLLGHAILPSLTSTHDGAPGIGTLRFVAYPVSLAALLLAAYALGRVLVLSYQLSEQIYPRPWV